MTNKKKLTQAADRSTKSADTKKKSSKTATKPVTKSTAAVDTKAAEPTYAHTTATPTKTKSKRKGRADEEETKKEDEEETRMVDVDESTSVTQTHARDTQQAKKKLKSTNTKEQTNSTMLTSSSTQDKSVMDMEDVDTTTSGEEFSNLSLKSYSTEFSSNHSITISETVQPYYSINQRISGEADEIYPTLHQHLVTLMTRLTPLTSIDQSLILEMIGLSTGDYLQSPSTMQQIKHIHTARPPSVVKAVTQTNPPRTWPSHPLVIEFGSLEQMKSNQHMIVNAPFKTGASWMFLFNELLTPSDSMANSSSTTPTKSRATKSTLLTSNSRSLPSSSALTYSFQPTVALGQRFKYAQSTGSGLTLVGDHLVLTCVFTEWVHSVDLDDFWKGWKMLEVIETTPVIKNEVYVPEKPEKD